LLSRVALVYSVQPLDWVARVLSLAGLIGLAGLIVRSGRQVPCIRAAILQRRASRSDSQFTNIGE
jgi:hypothetical protein